MPFLPLLAIFLFLANNSASAAMTRITARDTPAHLAAARFMRGINLGNYLEYAEGHPARNQTYTSRDLDLIRQEGFDHVRIPVAWHLGCGPAPDFQISQDLFSKADALINSALARGLAVMVDLHHFSEFNLDPIPNRPKIYALWRQIAAHYAAAPGGLAFEFLNEPNGAATTAIMNGTYPELIRQVRLTNPSRTLFVGPGDWNGIGELKTGTESGIVLPNDDRNIIVTVHCYDPYYFTHQGAEWALPDTATLGVKFPGPPATPLQPDKSITHQWVLDWFRDYNARPAFSNPSGPSAFQTRIRSVRLWADYWGRPTHIGEWGCYEKADSASRLAFIKSIREIMDAQRLGWAMWDWKSGFHYIRNEQPDPPGMREAVFPAPTISIPSSFAIRALGAVGKTYVLEATNPSLTPMQWQPVSTQTLTTNIVLFNVQTNLSAATLYRLFWQK